MPLSQSLIPMTILTFWIAGLVWSYLQFAPNLVA